MNTRPYINKNMYDYLKANAPSTVPLVDHKIVLDDCTKTIKIICKNTATTITVFAIANSMRYSAYTVDTFMGDIISTFGYESEVHFYLGQLMQKIDQTRISKT